VARLLVQLKLRLLRNALRSSAGAKVAFIASTVFAGLVAAGTFAVLALLRGQSASVDLTTVIFTLFAFGWLIVPIVAFGLDSTLDPATLALYPLRTRPLAMGLLAASAAGAWPLANVVGLLGVTVGLARGLTGLVIAVVAVVLEVLFCITLARFVTTSMARLLRSRRGKDLAALLVIPIFVLYEAFIQVVPRLTASGKLTAASFDGIDTWLRWLPPAWPRMRSRTRRPGTPAPRCCASR
jgi:ABC-2 type transport system permease protein